LGSTAGAATVREVCEDSHLSVSSTTSEDDVLAMLFVVALTWPPSPKDAALLEPLTPQPARIKVAPTVLTVSIRRLEIDGFIFRAPFFDYRLS
jgi:hypothetical protein